jgi:thiol-disulfide isomerase/thioredoxin
VKKITVILFIVFWCFNTLFAQKKAAELPKSVSDWLSNELKINSKFKKPNRNKEVFFTKELVRIIGYIKGFEDTSGFNGGIVYHENILTVDDYPTTIQIYPDGRFEVSYEAFHPHMKSLVFNNEFIEYYIEPGKTLGVVFNMKDLVNGDKLSLKNSVSFLGDLGQLNNELMSYKLGIPDYNDFSDDLFRLSPDEFSQKMLSAWDVDLKKFYESNHSKLLLSSAALIRNKIDVNYGARLFDFALHRSYLAKQDTTNEKLKIPITDSYYEFINRINLDDTTLLAQQDYFVFINRLEFSPLFPFAKYQDQANYEELILNDFHKFYKSEIIPFSIKVAFFRRKSASLKKLINKDDLLKKHEEFKKEITEPLFEKELNELLQTKLNKLEGYDLPNTLSAETFRKIIDNHRGKMLVVDFWAQWCGPCRIGIESTVDERTTLLDHPNLDFIFITDEEGTPDKEFFDNYNKENLMANSYRVSAADYRAFRELFKFNGIPRYILVNDQGKIMDDNFKRNLLKSELSGRFPEKFKDIDIYNTNKGGQ